MEGFLADGRAVRETIGLWEGGFPRQDRQAGLDMAATGPPRKARAGGISRHPAAGNPICENRPELARFACQGSSLPRFLPRYDRSSSALARFMMSVGLRRV